MSSERSLIRQQGGLCPAEERDGRWLDGVCAEGEALAVVGSARGLLIAAGAGEGAPKGWLACSLDAVSVPEVVTVLVTAGSTGALEVRDPKGVRRLFFEQGQYIGGTSSHANDRLGEVLWHQGRISLDQLVIASQTLEPGKRIGRVLVELGYIQQHELRPALATQARAIFEAACLEPKGTCVFLGGERHENPMRFVVDTDQLLDEVLAAHAECTELRAALASLDAPVRLKTPRPQGALGEAEEALLQLVASAKEPLTREALLEKSALSQRHGLRALHRLVTGGFLAPTDVATRKMAPLRPRLQRLCDGINLVMDVLGWDRGKNDHMVRQLLDDPPEHLAEALSGLSFEEPLDPSAVELQAKFAEGGVKTMEAALAEVLDLALFEARDVLDPAEVEKLEAEIAQLSIF